MLACRLNVEGGVVSALRAAEWACHPWAAGPSLSMLLRRLRLSRTVAKAQGPHSKVEERGMEEQPLVAGLVVVKRHLDLALADRVERIANDAAGLVGLVALMKAAGATLAVVEATGGYETAAVLALQ